MELRTWYRECLPRRIAALEEVKGQLENRTLDSIEAVRRIAHSLRGSGATYGFPEISDSARRLEEAGEGGLLGGVDALIRTLGSVYASSQTEKTSILVVEDDDDQAEFIAHSLGGPHREILQARSADEAQAILQAHNVSLILLDLILPDMDGRTFLARLRESLPTARIPVVVLTVRPASQVRAECFALGADDFLEKPVRAEALRDRVAARLELGAGLARELSRDSLTGLPNRAAFYELFKRMRNGVLTLQEPATAAMIVLDSFDRALQDHGQDVADAVVVHAASVLSRAFRSTDFLARFRGCEFTALFPRTGSRGAGTALAKALQALKAEPFVLAEGGTIPLSFSAGIAPVVPGRTLEDVLAEADRHLFLAQDSGGARGVSALDNLQPSRKKILIAEDDELNRMVLQRLFEMEGYDVRLYADGKAALQAAKVGPVSVVVTDGSMPRMDGFELVAQLRQLPEYSSIPIVMLTSMGSEWDIVRGFESGADDYVIKPFSSAELMARIRRLLKRSAARS
jgi:diguanylate cyclase (GGDEF)-like protein